MRKPKISDNSISKNKRRLLLVIKFILWIVISYFIIQLSIEAKEIEEKRNIPGLQTTMELADQYMKGKYWLDWQHRGSNFNYPDAHLSSLHFLELSSDVGMLWVSPYWGEDYEIAQIDMKKGNNDVCIWIFFKTDLNIMVSSNYKGNYTEYHLEYENGNYTRNTQMEQEIGFTTEEIVEQADKIRNAFEKEMEKMHQYQIGRAKERREKFTNFGLITFLLFFVAYLYLKWISINRRADIEDKYPEEVLEETIVKSKEKFLKRRYLLLGCGISFWIYILRPVVSEFMLFPLAGTANEYAAYGVSAVIAAVVFGMLWKRSVVGKVGKTDRADRADTVKQMLKSIFQLISGCVITLVVIQLGVIFVPRFYSPEWRFYKINLLAEAIAFLIFSIIVRTKKLRIGTDNAL